MAFLLLVCYTTLFLIALSFTNRLYNLYANYRATLPLNIPIVICLGSWQDPLSMILGPSIRSFLSRLRIIDPDSPDWTNFSWSQFERFAAHAKRGPAFAIVSPFKTNILIADVALARSMFKDWRTWIKNQDLYEMFNVFGTNVNSVNGDDWSRHRKVTAPAFKEANMKLVWNCALAQIDDALRKWEAGEETTLETLRKDTNKLVMHILMAASFGREYAFETGVQVPEEGRSMSFGEAMHTVIGSISPALVPITFAVAKLPTVLIPAGLKKLQVAVDEVRAFLRDAVEGESEALRNGEEPKDNLISTLVRANEEEKREGEGKRFPLMDRELYGNLFMFSMAGHETTSASISYGIPLLALYPEVQAWIREEVDAVCASASFENYTDLFPRLVRTLAFMYETQRFFPAVPFQPKYTLVPQTVTLNDRPILIPANTYVSIHYNAIHFDPSLWGPDVDLFRPSRFISSSSNPGGESFALPPTAEFFGWASGPRACPGKKFSQVEFVCAIARLVRGFEVLPARRGEETDAQARGRMKGVMEDVKQLVSLTMRDAEGAGVWIRRR